LIKYFFDLIRIGKLLMGLCQKSLLPIAILRVPLQKNRFPVHPVKTTKTILRTTYAFLTW